MQECKGANSADNKLAVQTHQGISGKVVMSSHMASTCVSTLSAIAEALTRM